MANEVSKIPLFRWRQCWHAEVSKIPLFRWQKRPTKTKTYMSRVANIALRLLLDIVCLGDGVSLDPQAIFVAHQLLLPRLPASSVSERGLV